MLLFEIQFSDVTLPNKSVKLIIQLLKGQRVNPKDIYVYRTV